MKPSDLKTLLIKAIANRLSVLITGAPGTGKSDVVAQAAAEAGADLIVSHPVVSDPTDFKGLPGIVDGQAEFLPFGDLRRLTEANRPTVAFLDDLGQAPPVVQAAAMQLILARQVNGHKVSDEVTFIAATNRRQDRAGVSGILEPVKSRFTTIIELEPDLDDWCTWAFAHNVPAELIGFLRFRPNFLHDFQPTADIKNSPCPRTVTNAGRLVALGVTDLEALSGAAGEGFATEFLAFLRIYRSLPSPDAVLMNPETADVPTDPATLYALCGALAGKASEQTAERLLTYAGRLPTEFNVLLTRDAVRREPAMAQTPAFAKWASLNSDVLV